MRYSVKCTLRRGGNVHPISLDCVEFTPTVGIPDYLYYNLDFEGVQLLYSPKDGNLWATQNHEVVGRWEVTPCQQ